MASLILPGAARPEQLLTDEVVAVGVVALGGKQPAFDDREAAQLLADRCGLARRAARTGRPARAANALVATRATRAARSAHAIAADCAAAARGSSHTAARSPA